MTEKKNSLFYLHIAVLLFGLAGLFGKLLALPPVIIVLGRVLFSSIFLLFLSLVQKRTMKLKTRKHYIYLVLMGVILAIHWTTFFQSIQVSTVAIGLLTFSTFPVIVTFLEPIFFQERIKKFDIMVACITFLGVLIVIPKFELSNSMTQGVIWGLISGLTYGLLSLLNRRFVQDYSSITIALYEQLIASMVLIPFYIIQRPVIMGEEILILILLGVVFTGISHSLFIHSLRYIKAQTAGIISTLEPVYGIVLAAILIREIPSIKEIIGGGIILGMAFLITCRSK
jgi:drug/metabolite transporter (DMT)-like permease